MRLHIAAVATPLLVSPLAPAAADPPPAATHPPATRLLHGGHRLDPAAGRALGASTIMIERDRVVAVEPGRHARPGAVVSDLGRSPGPPGLIDAHVNLMMQFGPTTYGDPFRLTPSDCAIRGTLYARRTLQAGFTPVRKLGDIANESFDLRNGVNSGLIEGPSIYTAGEPFGSTGGHPDPPDRYRMDLAGDPGPLDVIINRPADAWKARRAHYKLGVAGIKIMPSDGVLDESDSGDNPQLTLDEITAVVAAAQDCGYTVAANAHDAGAIRRAVLGGGDSIEHGTYKDAADMVLMKQLGTWCAPTISAGEFMAPKTPVPGYRPPQVAAKAAAIGPWIMATAGHAYRAVATIAFGTDPGVYPHGDNAKEFPYMVEDGIPVLAAIRSATVNAANLLRHPTELGRIAPGYHADAIAVAGDPLADVSRLQQAGFVMKDGVVFKRDGHATDA